MKYCIKSHFVVYQGPRTQSLLNRSVPRFCPVTMSAVFNRRVSGVLDAKLVLSGVAQTSLRKESLSSRRESKSLDGVTQSDSCADEFSGFPLTDEIGVRDLATLTELTEETIVEELKKRYVSELWR
jgi:hypothetical protein